MQTISSSTRPLDRFASSREDRDVGEASSNSQELTGYEDPIEQANSVPFLLIAKRFGIIPLENSNITCPFPSHQNGRESSPSFRYYPKTNSYNCFGCRQGYSGVDFVALMENCSKLQAANKILQLFSSEVDEDLSSDHHFDLNERLDILMQFSHSVRKFRQQNAEVASTESYALHLSQTLDQLVSAYPDMDNQALSSIIERLVEELSNFDSSRSYLF